MLLIINIIDFQGNIIANLIDHTGILKKIIAYCQERPGQFSLLKYVDFYDDTTFNSMQVPDLLQDITHLMTLPWDEAAKDALLKLQELIALSTDTPHQYVCFSGD